MSTQSTGKGTEPKRQFHRPEQKRSPHRRSSLSKEVASAIPGRDAVGSSNRERQSSDRPSPREKQSVKRRQSISPMAAGSKKPAKDRPAGSPTRPGQFDIRMAFTLFGFATAALFVILFGLDLAVGVPFQRVSLLMDVTYLLCGLALGWLSWSCLRDLR